MSDHDVAKPTFRRLGQHGAAQKQLGHTWQLWAVVAVVCKEHVMSHIKTKFVVLWEHPEFPRERVWVSPPPRGTPWGPPDSGVEWNGWAVLAVREEREAAAEIARRVKKDGQKVRLERWVYEPGNARARCFVERL
jgi:hypothetical protein